MRGRSSSLAVTVRGGAPGSRIQLSHATAQPPQFGTPEEDAHRRDFTINSLFYNINDGVIEDFTKQ